MSQNQEKPSTSGNRRTFLKQTATATAVAGASSLMKVPVYGQDQPPSTGRVIGANDRINVGFVGVGSQGFNTHIREIKNNAWKTKQTKNGIA